jgi:steroid delta-isomerase-like uncharacterized protein
MHRLTIPGWLLSQPDGYRPGSSETSELPVNHPERCRFIVSGVSAVDDPKQLAKRFVEELWNERRLDVADAIFAKDCVTHQLRSGSPADAVPRGPQAIKEHVTHWVASFPDLRFSIEQMLREGDHVVMQLLMEGTHHGAWLGIPATGKKVQIRMFTVHRVVQDRIVEDWVLVESLGVFQQLGVVPDTADLLSSFLRQQVDTG